MSTRLRLPSRLRLVAAATLVALGVTTPAAATVYPTAAGPVDLYSEIESAYLAHGGPGGLLGEPVTTERSTASWTLGWNTTMDATGGKALLVADGRLTDRVDGTDPFFHRHPRTGIGVTATARCCS